MIVLTENDEYQIIESLKLNRAKRAKAGEVFIEGIEAIKQAAAAGIALTRIVCSGKTVLSGWAGGLFAAYPDAKIIKIADALYKKLCDRQEPSEIIATAKINHLKLTDLVLPEKPFIVLFDRPSDTGNLGSVIRSANSFGADALLILGHGADVYDPKTIRASLGSVFHTKVVQIESMGALEEFIKNEKARCGLKVIGTDSRGEVSLTTEKPRRPILLALGNEAKGLSIALKNLCGSIVSIPISGEVNSLNVASAASIFMWEIYRNSLYSTLEMELKSLSRPRSSR
jgi:TrmH family RNA methyltransferase